MSDVEGLDERELADLAALADGTLPAERRAEVEARVAASPVLQERLARQRRAVAAVRTLETDREPASLRASLEPRRSRLLRPQLAFAGALAVVAVVVVALSLTGGPGAPTVADAAELASRPSTGPAPRVVGTRLGVDVEGLAFPELARAYGWRAVGVRRGRVDGRDTVVVYYAKGDRRAAYAIVDRPTLDRPSRWEPATIDGVRYQTIRLGRKLVVTWRRAGHTCVLVGDATRSELLRLASWPVTPIR
jgi:hypothetical protein